MESSGRFVGLRRTTARVSPIGELEVQCQKGGHPVTLAECARCRRFADARLAADERSAAIYCRWTSDDPVHELMTRASALATVEPLTTLDEAEERAQRAGVRHLLVIAGDQLVGMVCRCDLVAPHDPGDVVVSRMSCPVVDVAPSATLGEALDAMNRYRVGCVPVVGGTGVVLGIVTRGDLRRAGAPEEALGGGHCVACGSTHGVCADHTGIDYCLDCLDRARACADDEIGNGD